jgi:hypothetical protein
MNDEKVPIDRSEDEDVRMLWIAAVLAKTHAQPETSTEMRVREADALVKAYRQRFSWER